jgi:hypothetical protein
MSPWYVQRGGDPSSLRVAEMMRELPWSGQLDLRRWAVEAPHPSVEILLPAGFEPVASSRPEGPAQGGYRVARFAAMEASAVVTARRVEREVDVREWVRRVLGGIVIENELAGGPSWLMWVTRDRERDAAISWVVAFKAPPAIVMIQTQGMPADDPRGQSWLGALRDFLGKGEHFLETLQRIEGREPRGWRTVVPASWHVKHGARSKAVTSFQAELHEGPRGALGHLSFALQVPEVGDRPRDPADRFFRLVEAHGIQLTDRPKPIDEEPPPGWERSHLVVPRAMRAGVEGIVRCWVLTAPRIWALGGLISASVDEIGEAALHNLRAFDLMRRYLRVS